jgi:hypothetical protein
LKSPGDGIICEISTGRRHGEHSQQLTANMTRRILNPISKLPHPK